ncbi:hypothetical protein ACTXT7_008013 [Hymenolepis weldensis]
MKRNLKSYQYLRDRNQMSSCHPLLNDIKNYSPLSVHIELKLHTRLVGRLVTSNKIPRRMYRTNC